MAPRVGSIWKAVQENDERTVTLLEISELEAVCADAVYGASLPDRLLRS